MTSAINYASIDETFPVAGQDNDTQTFRDNFDTIKSSLQSAASEISDLQANAAKLNEDNDFENKIISRAVFQNNVDKKFDGGAITSTLTVDLENGPYQIYRIGSSINIDFLNFPTTSDPLVPGYGVGKVTLELYGDDTERVLSLITTGGTVLMKSPGFPTTLSVTSSTNPTFIEVWQHSTDYIFARYLGTFE
jgi:hypothetical protein